MIYKVSSCKLRFLGMIQNRDIDFAISIFSLNQYRMSAVDYMITRSKPARGYIYIQNPKETFDWEVYGQPFWQQTWIGIAIFCAVVPIVMAMILAYRKI